MQDSTRPRLGAKLAEWLEIPLDTVIDWPRLEVSGNRGLIIKNHRGIMEYTTEIVRIHTKFGELRISGIGLRLTGALKEEIRLEGRFDRIEFIDWR